MMNDKILKIIYDAIADLNGELQNQDLNNPTVGTHLYGEKGVLDSLALVNLVVSIEQTISVEMGVGLVLADEKAVSKSRSPFKTVGTLAEYIENLLGDKK